ncbi:uncharacterized protein TRUGW13939_01227 [Talaromyces rugulosus]|uniref:Uncharacterized protein n=1 Tax=Talaromyces rugulosus TaxID=121627 RepID=A0A7H8QLV1_TALRU|nr:uncharacterized protein TRUGW13939_01227 [Talaromyces rugulosus]QKX54143.1 hypothetical protein TRUGW13939_01227 [Talaromyces rugulosus]
MPITATPWFSVLLFTTTVAPVVGVIHCPGDQAPAASEATCSPDPIDDQEAQFKHQPGRLVHTNHDNACGEPPGKYPAVRSLLTIRGICSLAELIAIGSPLLDVVESSATPPHWVPHQDLPSSIGLPVVQWTTTE